MQQDQKRAGAAPEGGALEIKSLLGRFRTG